MLDIKHIGVVLLSFFLLQVIELQSQKLMAPPEGKIYIAAYPDFGGSEDIVTIERITNYIHLAGKEIAWAYFSDNWTNGIHFPLAECAIITQTGSTPYIRMMTRTRFDNVDTDTNYSLQKIIDGNFDSELSVYAQAAKKFQHPLLMEFDCEMNGDWFAWSGVYNGGGETNGYGDPSYPDGPERYRDAYRHIIDLFRAQSVSNVTWFFHPDCYNNPETNWNKQKYYYPGDDYIDWVGPSVYGPQSDQEGYWDTFSTIMADTYLDLQEITSGKPFMLLEWGVSDNNPNGNKADWLHNAFDTIIKHQYIDFKGISYWHETWTEGSEHFELRIDSSAASLSMYQLYAASNVFVSDLQFTDTALNSFSEYEAASCRSTSNIICRIYNNPLFLSDVKNGEALEIRCKFKEGADVQIEVYTVLGVLVATLKPKNDGVFFWYGRNDYSKEVADGIYLLLMRVDGDIVDGPVRIGYIKK